MHCAKLLGQRLMARDFDRQTAEIQILITLMNRFNALGTAESVRVSRRHRGKGPSRPKVEFCNMCNRPMRKRYFRSRS